VVLVVGGVAGGVVLLNRRASRNPLNGLSPGLYQSTEDSGETLPLPRH
jgi:hypothetical protein